MEDCILFFLSSTFSYLKKKSPKLKTLFFLLVSLAVIIMIAMDIIMLLSYFNFEANSNGSIAEWGSFIVAFWGVLYAVIQYKNHIKEERRKVLCEYNQRYSSDKNIESVIQWMHQVSKTDPLDGDIIGVDKNVKCVPPTIHQKEMFMRFFEELNLRLEKKDMNMKEVHDMFSYYALKYDKYWDFRLDINDYKSDLEKRGMHEADRIKYKDNWNDFHGFIEKMQEVERRNSSKKL